MHAVGRADLVLVLLVEVFGGLLGDLGLGDHLGLDVLLDGQLVARLLAQQRLGQAGLLERLLIDLLAGELLLARRHLLVQLLVGGADVLSLGLLLQQGDADQLVEHPLIDLRGQGDRLAPLGQLHLHHLGALEEVVLLDHLAVHLGHHVRHLLRGHRRGGRIGRIGRIGRVARARPGEVERGRARGGSLAGLGRLPRSGRGRRGGRAGSRLRGLAGVVGGFTGGPGGEQQGEPQDKERRSGHGLLVHLDSSKGGSRSCRRM